MVEFGVVFLCQSIQLARNMSDWDLIGSIYKYLFTNFTVILEFLKFSVLYFFQLFQLEMIFYKMQQNTCIMIHKN